MRPYFRRTAHGAVCLAAALFLSSCATFRAERADRFEKYSNTPAVPILESNQKLLDRLIEKNAVPNPANRDEYFKQKEKTVQVLRELFRLKAYPDFKPRLHRYIKEEKVGAVTRRLLEIETEEGFYIPVYYFIPEWFPAPLILIVPGHGLGKAQAGTLIESHQNSIAIRLAEAGFAVVAADFRGFGATTGWIRHDEPLEELQKKSDDWFIGAVGQDRDPIYQQNVVFTNLIGRTNTGNFLYDARQLISYFSELMEVDGSRIGVGGISFGGKIVILLSLIDERIKAAVSSTSSIPSVKRSARVNTKLVRVHETPGALQYGGIQRFYKYTAPVPVLFDMNQERIEEAKPVIKVIENNYSLIGAERRVSFHAREKPYTFSVGATIDWFKRWLM